MNFHSDNQLFQLANTDPWITQWGTHNYLVLINVRPFYHSLRLGTEKGQREFWERRISMICLCSKYVKNCSIFGQILNIWVKSILEKKIYIFFQCLALPKDPQSFGSQNLRCPFLVSQYYRRRRLCLCFNLTVVSWDMYVTFYSEMEQNIEEINHKKNCVEKECL